MEGAGEGTLHGSSLLIIRTGNYHRFGRVRSEAQNGLTDSSCSLELQLGEFHDISCSEDSKLRQVIHKRIWVLSVSSIFRPVLGIADQLTLN